MADAPAVDLTNCDREPIHQLGLIQPFAWLLAFTVDWTVCRASENIDGLLGKDAYALLGTPMLELFGEEVVHTLRGRCALLGGGSENGGVERIFGLRLFAPRLDDRYDVALHYSDRIIVLEIEPHRIDRIGEASSMIRSIMTRLDNAAQLEDFLRSGARAIRAVTEFDRVMIYRFDRDGHGAVVAEARAAGIDSFLGQHYPASDIPKQARALYLRSPFRIIADVAAVPVPVFPALNEFGEPLDLSMSIARSVSPIHIEYLRNMGIAASLSISIIVEGALWGLIACHHHQPILPSFNARSLAELFGQMFSLRLEARLRKAITEREREARAIGDRLLAGIADDAELLTNPAHISHSLQSIIPSDGVGTLVDGKYAAIGHALPQDVAVQLGKRLNAMEGGRVLVEERLSRLLPGAPAYVHLAAGVMAIPLSRRPRDYVFLFRRERARTVSWGGNPEKPVTLGENGARLTPRGSFETWLEEVRESCAPFTESELAVGEALRTVMIEVILRITHSAQEQTRRHADRQEVLIAELNHRVRNILALIRGIVRQSAHGAASIEDYIALLDGRIESLARAHDQITRERWAAAPMRPLFETEAKAYLQGKADRVTLEGPELLLEPEAYTTIALVVHELVTNSAKYGALSDSGTILVRWSVDEEDRLVIEWRESGGPPVRAPTRRGFGSTIIERAVAQDLGGESSVDYAITGVVARFVVPRRYFQLQREAVPNGLPVEAPPAPESATGVIPPRHVLLVEDSLIIALDVEHMLGALGVERVSVAASVGQALGILGGGPIDLALLDVNLGFELSLPVAAELLARDVPFAFVTGYGDQIELGAEYAAVPVLQKPYGRAELVEMVQRLAG